MYRLFVHATNVHQGGGRALLTAIANSLPSDMQSILHLDSRMHLPDDIPKNVQVRRGIRSVLQRFFAECWLINNVEEGDIVLCLGNLPPLFKLRGHTIVFVQNRHLVDDAGYARFSLKNRLKLYVERRWLFGRVSNSDVLIVQTPTMKRLLVAQTKGKVPVRVMPFVDDCGGYVRKVRQGKIGKAFDFIYVASGEPHKNHRRLIEAWCILAEEGVFPALKITVDQKSYWQLCLWVEQQTKRFGLKVENVGDLPHVQITQLYEQTGALIYPSTIESFGLPLVEARQAGLPVLAPELDYIRDLVDPEQTFDPNSAISIARAVKRFLEIEEPPLDLQNVQEFVGAILGGQK